MRILIATRRYWPLVGGAEVVLRRLAAELARRRHTVTVLTQQWRGDWPADEVDQDVAVARLPVPDLRFVGTAVYMRRVSGWLRTRRDQFDVCYTSMLKHTAYVSVRTGRRLGLPVALRPECSGRSGDIYWQQTANFGRRIADVCRQADALVALSPTVRDELIGAGYPASAIREIPNGVPTPAEANPAERSAWRVRMGLADAPTVVFTGRLAPQKGLGTLVAAWAHVLQRVPGAQLVLVGDGEEADRLRRQAAEAGLGETCRLVGAAPDVDPYLRAADGFVLPSLDEGMSIALLEAMAVGLPVVASDIAANRAVVEPNRTGWLAPTDDPHALAATLVRVLEDPAQGRRRGAEARRTVFDRWSMSRMADAHVTLFEQMIQGVR